MFYSTTRSRNSGASAERGHAIATKELRPVASQIHAGKDQPKQVQP
jgi:hypothetical protein